MQEDVAVMEGGAVSEAAIVQEDVSEAAIVQVSSHSHTDSSHSGVISSFSFGTQLVNSFPPPPSNSRSQIW